MYPEIVKGYALYDIDHGTGLTFITHVEDIAVNKITLETVTQHLINNVQIRAYNCVFIPVQYMPFGKLFHICRRHRKILF